MKNCMLGKRVYPSSLFSTNLANDNYTLTYFDQYNTYEVKIMYCWERIRALREDKDSMSFS